MKRAYAALTQPYPQLLPQIGPSLPVASGYAKSIVAPSRPLSPLAAVSQDGRQSSVPAPSTTQLSLVMLPLRARLMLQLGP